MTVGRGATKAYSYAPTSGDDPYPQAPLPQLFRLLMKFREELNLRKLGMCSLSNFVIKRPSAYHSWRPSSKTLYVWLFNCSFFAT